MLLSDFNPEINPVLKPDFSDDPIAPGYSEKQRIQVSRVRSKEITLDYIPTEEVPLITLNESQILSQGNLLGIVAHAGVGKSNVMEVFVAACLKEECDTFQLAMNLPEGKRSILIDTERTANDFYKGIQRIVKRTEAQRSGLISEDGRRLKGVEFYSFIEIPSMQDRIEELERLAKSGNIGLMIIDGIADFVNDPNKPEETTPLIALIVALANKYQFGVVLTIHGNPNDDSGKPRGHLGSEIYRKAECLLQLKRAPGSPDIRLLTTNFPHGKNRNDGDNMEVAFQWSDEAKMFVSVVYASSCKPLRHAKVKEIIDAIFAEHQGMQFRHGELLKLYMIQGKVKEKSAKNGIATALENGWVRKLPTGQYYQEIPF